MLLNVADYEMLAHERLDKTAYDYYAGAAADEWTLAENVAAYRRRALRFRVLVDVSHIDASTTVLGNPIAAPILLAPTAFNRLAHPEGELAAARAAAAAGTVMVTSTLSTWSLEEIRGAATGPLWFQLYIYRDREVTRSLVQRAEAAGYQALVLTVDTPVLGLRERDARNGFALPPGLEARNFTAGATAGLTRWEPGASFLNYFQGMFDPALTWDIIAWLRSITRLPLLLKGIVTAEDAQLALQHGVDGIIVSNHGGRQLDGAEATINALPGVVDTVAGAVDVLVDGGIRRGSDVLQALALGARAVLIGRPYLWGLAVDGEAGVARVLALLREELERAMALCGRPTIAALDRSLIAVR